VGFSIGGNNMRLKPEEGICDVCREVLLFEDLTFIRNKSGQSYSLKVRTKHGPQEILMDCLFICDACRKDHRFNKWVNGKAKKPKLTDKD
jgi:hypothetical protein